MNVPNIFNPCLPICSMKLHTLWKHPVPYLYSRFLSCFLVISIDEVVNELHEPFHWKANEKVFWPCDNDIILTYDLDLQAWPRYSSTWFTCRNSGPYVCLLGQENGDTRSHTHKDTHNVKTITPVTCAGCYNFTIYHSCICRPNGINSTIALDTLSSF